ncbi:MAG: flagellar assembly protein FliH [Deltaproteobacteria bacterium]|jgi:flagellar assembly protein FliH|nr:flagellar assembly protein FliH [Deltaproteobacteria bacterium]
MSSSDADKPKTWGNVYMGGVAMSLANLEGEKNQNWTEADEAAYLERVKRKAVDMAAGIVDEAKREAAAIRETARREGYDEGMAQAEQEIEEFQATVGGSVSAVLSAIEGQCSAIFAAWREDLVALLRLAAEKAVGMALVDDKARLLEEVYTQAVAALENRRNLVIRVNPEDEPAIADIVAMTQARFPDLKAWSVKGDAAVSPGGLIVESDDSLADNRMEKRAALVNEILNSLTLPQG